MMVVVITVMTSTPGAQIVSLLRQIQLILKLKGRDIKSQIKHSPIIPPILLEYGRISTINSVYTRVRPTTVQKVIGSLQSMIQFSVLPRPFQHSDPPCLLHPFSFDVVTQMIDVVTNSVQTTPTRYAIFFPGENPAGLFSKL